MSTPSARRALLFDTPVRPAKRARVTKNSRKKTMRIPRSLLPEMKHFSANSLNASDTNHAESNLTSLIVQGDDFNQFIGSKFRFHRLRVNYDFTGVAGLTQGIRILLVRHHASYTPSPTGWSTTNQQPDFNRDIILFDRMVPTDNSTRTGTFDVPLRMLVKKWSTGGVFNADVALSIVVVSPSTGAAIQSRVGYTVWFTDN